MAEVHGHAARGYARVKDAFARAQAKDPGGAQLCIYRGGEIVLDLWTGRDPANARAYGPDTVTILMSCTKIIVSVCAHMLAERGQLDLHAPAARYWPEFAAAGKSKLTTAHMLAHSAGLPGFARGSGLGVRELRDWEACTAALAAMRPLWPPGKAYLYHPITFGFLVGEIIRRVSGKTVGRFIADEIAEPLKLDLWMGLPKREEARLAPHFRATPPGDTAHWTAIFEGLGFDARRALTANLIEAFVLTDALIEGMKQRPLRVAEIPAGNAIGTARALAKALAACIGEIDGVRLLSPAALRRARTPQTDALGPPPPFPNTRGDAAQRLALGFELPRSIMPMLGPNSFGHPGAGGRVAYADPDAELAVAFVCNNMLWDGFNPDPRWIWNDALRELTLPSARPAKRGVRR